MWHQVLMIGNLGRDPEMRYLPDGTPVTQLSVASNRKYTANNGEAKEETVWTSVSVFGKAGEAANTYLSKGRQVFVQGRLRPDPHTGGPRIFARQDGSAGASYEIVAETVKFLGNGNGNYNAVMDGANGPGEITLTVEEDAIPF